MFMTFNKLLNYFWWLFPIMTVIFPIMMVPYYANLLFHYQSALLISKAMTNYYLKISLPGVYCAEGQSLPGVYYAEGQSLPGVYCAEGQSLPLITSKKDSNILSRRKKIVV